MALGALSVTGEPHASSLPVGFSEETVFSGLTEPTTVQFSPDGRAFVLEKSGLIKEFDDLNDTTPTIVADLRTEVHNWWDRGALGLAIDPSFTSGRPYLYVLYTYDAPIGQTAPWWGTVGGTSDDCAAPPNGPGMTDGCWASARLAKITVGPGNTMTGSEQVLVNDWCVQFNTHSIGTVRFGPDGALYVGGGEGANADYVDYGQAGGTVGSPTDPHFVPKNPCGDPPGGVGGSMTPPTAEGGALRSQSLRRSDGPAVLNGTIIRVDPDTGAALPSNPLASSSDPNARRIIAYGLRNPYRWTFRPGANELWIADVGQSTTEEIDRIANTTDSTVENFGWPCYEGPVRQSGWDAANLNLCENLYVQGTGAVTMPYFSYQHSSSIVQGDGCPTGSSAISGIAFYNGGSYPASYNGALFFTDYVRNCIWVMYRGSNGLPDPASLALFAGAVSSPVDLEIGPGGDLFYVDLTNGTIRRIRYGVGTQATLGKTAVGASTDPAPNGYKWGNKYTLAQQGTFSKVSAYLADNTSVTGGQSLRAAIYADVSGMPGALKAQSTVITVPDGQAPAWVDFPISPGVTLPAGTYWIVLQAGTTNNGVRRYGDSSGGAEAYNADAFSDGIADPFGTAGIGGWSWSLYATYTTSSGGGGGGGTPGTLGKTTVGASTSNARNGYKWWNKYTLSEQGRFSKVSAYLADNTSVTGGQSLRAAIYADAAGVPGALEAQSSVVTVPDGKAAGWVDFPISPGVTLPAGTYWIVLQAGTRNNGSRRYGDSLAGAERYNADAFSDGIADPFGTAGIGGWSWSLYATYTTSGSGNNPPTPTIDTPSSSFTWKVGDVINFSGSATDPEDGTLPASALTWVIRIKHCDPADPTSCHYHPIQTLTGVSSGSFTAPDHEYPSFLQFDLTATDSNGATGTATVLLSPQTVDLTLASNPTGLTLGFNLDSGTAPLTRTVIIGSTNSISAPDQSAGGTSYTFSSWSDGGAATHTITASSNPATYTASFTSAGGGTGGTLGKTAVGASSDLAPNGYKWGNKYSLSQQGTFSKVSAYLADNQSVTGGQTLRAAIYLDLGGLPGALAAQSSTVTVRDGQAAAWVDFPISPGVTLAPGTYWIVLQAGTPNNGARRYGDGAAGAEAYNADAFSDGISNPFGTASIGGWSWSLYATYTS